MSSSSGSRMARTSPGQNESLLPARKTDAGQESQTVRECEQADLEFDGENLATVRSERHSRVAASAIGNTADRAGMNIAVPLRESGREWHSNVNPTRLYKLERRSQRLHESLSCETASNFVRSGQSVLPSNEIKAQPRLPPPQLRQTGREAQACRPWRVAVFPITDNLYPLTREACLSQPAPEPFRSWLQRLVRRARHVTCA
jgi:hypothetical protein